MSVIHHRRERASKGASGQQPPTPAVEATGRRQAAAARRAVATLRIAFGFTFLWAFFDKLLALGYSTGVGPDGSVDRFGDAAWIHGGSPTEGFLKFGADGPFDSFYHSIAGDAWADWLFMLGLLGVGVTMTLGAGMRIGAAAGALMYLLMWSVVLPPENNPIIDDHILGAIALVTLALLNAGNAWGLGRWWTSTSVVRRYPVLQ